MIIKCSKLLHHHAAFRYEELDQCGPIGPHMVVGISVMWPDRDTHFFKWYLCKVLVM